jgi:hypothetical protein
VSPFAHKKRTTERRCWLVHSSSTVAILTTETSLWTSACRLLPRMSWSWTVIHTENVLLPLQLFYFHLWPVYSLSLAEWTSDVRVQQVIPGHYINSWAFCFWLLEDLSVCIEVCFMIRAPAVHHLNIFYFHCRRETVCAVVAKFSLLKKTPSYSVSLVFMTATSFTVAIFRTSSGVQEW